MKQIIIFKSSFKRARSDGYGIMRSLKIAYTSVRCYNSINDLYKRIRGKDL